MPEEKENLFSRQLNRPSGLLSVYSTPRSTPRATPVRSISPFSLSYRSTSINMSSTEKRHRFMSPKFYAVPHSRCAEEGETVQFQCAIAGHPTPWSTWDKDGIIVTPATRITIKERDDLRILEISEVTFEDAGLYRITLENDYGRVEATARLDIIGNRRSAAGRSIRTSASPRRNISISRRIMGNSTKIGGRLALATNLRGSSVPSCKFYHNGNEVDAKHVHLEADGDQFKASVIIENARLENEGIYTCIAENADGIVASTTAITLCKSDEIREPPAIVAGLEVIRLVEGGKHLDLTCIVQSQSPFDVLWKRDDKLLTDSDDFWYAVLSACFQSVFRFDFGIRLLFRFFSRPFLSLSISVTLIMVMVC